MDQSQEVEKLAFVPGKSTEEFRNYEDSFRHSVVERHYRMMRENQTVEFGHKMQKKHHTFNRKQMTIYEAFEELGSFVDASDPDTDAANLDHMFQTAERIRKAGHPDWFQLTGLLHDLGKMLFLWGCKQDGQEGTADGDQWGLVGDTWVLGCRIPEKIVFPEFNALNPDMKNEKYNTELGIYEPGCGFMDNCLFAYGHDEYLYQVLKFNKSSLPEAALAMIRLHSCYPWHEGNAYEALMTPRDHELKDWVKKFNAFDLYTKSDEKPDVEKLWPYYQTLIDKYCPGKLWW